MFKRMLGRVAPLVVVVLTLAPGAVCAAAAVAPRMPNTLRRGVPAWLGYFVMFVLAVVVISISLMPSKRGHQD